VHRWFYTIMLIFVAILGLEATAQDDPGLNYREICRRAASGAFATATGDLALAEDSVVLAKNGEKKAHAVVEIHEAKIKLVHKKLKSKDYSTELFSERDSLAAQIKLYHEQYTSSQEQLKQANKNLVAAKKRHRKLKQKIDPIFKSYFSDDPDGTPRKLFNKLEWKSECPKYRSLCPLPESDAKALVSLVDEIDDQDFACHRYAKMK
jgi:hypothetical protein